MDTILITDESHPLFDSVWATYNFSFPEFEKRLKRDQINVLKDERYKMFAIVEDDLYIGFIMIWEFDNFCFIEHFAIDPSNRGKSYGRSIIKEIQKQFADKTIILEIDPPIDEISIRRLNFYTSLGFIFSDIYHLNLPYQIGGEGHQLNIMAYPSPISESEYNVFNNFLNTEVIKYCQV